MDKATLLHVAANTKVLYPEPREKKEGGNKNSAHDDGSPSHTIRQRAFRFFELSTSGSNHSMALIDLFISFNRVGQLYYGLANLLKVCVSNLMLDTSNLDTKKLYIVYKVDLG